MWALITTKLGAWAAGIAAVLAALGTVVLEARHAGVKAQQAADDTQNLEHVESANETKESVAAAAPDTRRNELQRWQAK